MSVTRLTGMASGLDTESIIKQLSSKYTAKKEQVWKKQESLKYKQNAWKDMNKDVYDLYTKLSNFRMTGNYQKNELTSSDKNVVEITSGNLNGQQSVTVNQIATQTFVTGGKVNQSESIGISGTIAVQVGGKEQDLNITPDMSMAQVARKLTEMGIVSNFDEGTSRLFMTSKTTGAESNFSITGDSAVLNALGLGSTAVKSAGQDAIINLNGAEFTSSTNNFNINGMSIVASAPGSTVIGSKTTDTIFNTVKEFITSYNSLIKKIDIAYGTNNSSYKPLTDDEKYALSDKQVDEWENKLKDGALYKDSNLNAIGNVLKNTMSMTSIDGDYLSTFGISLGNYLTTDKEDRYVYNIDEDKLKDMINKNPDRIVNFMTKLAANLYDKIGNEMKSSSMRSVYTVYDDKKMKQELTEYERKIKEWETKIDAYEEKYYKKFAKMEALLSSSQNQSNYFSNFFGM